MIYDGMFFDACSIDWPAHVEQWKKLPIFWIKEIIFTLYQKEPFFFRLCGKKWIVAIIKQIFLMETLNVSPIWDTVKGVVTFDFRDNRGKVIHNLN